MKDLISLKEKVAVVTGGGGLLGSTICQIFTEFGAKVYVADLDTRAGARVVKRLKTRRAINRSLDISSESSLRTLLSEIIGNDGRIDIWVNCAYPRTTDWGKNDKVSGETWRANVDMHLNGYCLSCLQVAQIMKKIRHGSIINLCSIYGMIGPTMKIYQGTSLTMPAAYAAMKGGILNFTRYLACTLGPFGVRANSISPGGIYHRQPKRFVRQYEAEVPLGRMGTPVDVAGAALYLASEISRYVTGHNLVVDGGWTAK